MPADWRDRTALITGAGRGIGRAIALRLATAGCKVVLAARTETELRTVADTVEARGGHALALVTDVAIDEQIERLVHQATQHFGDVSVLANCAGFAPPRTAYARMSSADIDRTLRTCLHAPMHLSRLCLGPMLARRRGAILNIASRAAHTSRAGEAAYSAAKAGLLAFSRSLFHEVRDCNVKIITISPGYVDTAFIPPNRRIDRSAFLRAEDVAEAAFEALCTRDGACCTELTLEPQVLGSA